MKTSRSLSDLHRTMMPMAFDFVNKVRAAKLDMIVTCTLRDDEAQAELFAQGRTKPGKVVTNARPGESMHNYGLAMDVVPIVMGKPVWGTTGKDLELWQHIGEIGKECGLEWAGDWRFFKEYPHFQFTGGLTIAQLKEGQRP